MSSCFWHSGDEAFSTFTASNRKPARIAFARRLSSGAADAALVLVVATVVAGVIDVAVGPRVGDVVVITRTGAVVPTEALDAVVGFDVLDVEAATISRAVVGNAVVTTACGEDVVVLEAGGGFKSLTRVTLTS